MNRKCAGWKWLFRVGILTMLTAPCLQAAEKVQTALAEALPLDNVRGYVSGCFTNTSLQNARAAKELKGKFYSGVMVVANVEQGSTTIEIKANEIGGRYSLRMTFSVEDAQLQEKAAQLRKGDKILITARLRSIGEGTEALFNDVQSLDIQPKDQTEQKK